MQRYKQSSRYPRDPENGLDFVLNNEERAETAGFEDTLRRCAKDLILHGVVEMAKILVVDDDRNLRDLLVDILLDAEHDVIEAKNGIMALVKAHQEHPDLILLDVRMPLMDGFEVLKHLREEPDTKAIPVVMLTGSPARAGELPAWRLGAKHYITKPFDPERLELTVKVALSEAETADEEATDGTRLASSDSAGVRRLAKVASRAVPSLLTDTWKPFGKSPTNSRDQPLTERKMTSRRVDRSSVPAHAAKSDSGGRNTG